MTSENKLIYIGPNDALIIVDLQNDFCPGGALAVPNGDKIVLVVNQLMPLFQVVVATKDWHPVDHCSFKDFGGQWPAHCVWNTPGARFHPNLDQHYIRGIFFKGFEREKDAYSGLEGEGGRYFSEEIKFSPSNVRHHRDCKLIINPTHFLREQYTPCIARIFIVGLATDYCVKATVLDGLKLGFEVYVVTDAIAAVNVNPGDGEKALQEMIAAGAKLCESSQIHPPKPRKTKKN